ncbi:hypothetical protein H0I83_24625 [Bacillus thuringiensis serovar fukuokaensis]|uniref:hypothetical protein n=1 Tax=Bacillus thuringiensis TaxID=1428 RepID=UPI0012988111|nr:hypothetical protein [Bacillus thuringiensis]MRB11281.1 hypothetical protein [Bacillus thuringiensis]
MKKIKHWIHPFHDTAMFKKTFPPSLYCYIENMYYTKKKQKQRLAVSAFSTIY